MKKSSERVFSRFEFWPGWAFYSPLAIYWLYLAAKYKSMTLGLLANPRITTGGLCGERKSSVLMQAGKEAQKAIAPFIIFKNSKYAFQRACTLMEKQKISFPAVLKPNISFQGTGVRKVKTAAELKETLPLYPKNAELMIQKLIDYPFEAGIFYIRDPDDADAKITSITEKYQPTLIGDGSHTVLELLDRDPRMSKLQILYLDKIKGIENDVLPLGKSLPLVFVGNHCRGSIFKNGKTLNTPELSARINSIMKDIPEFYYGRIDLKASSRESLQQGNNLEIIEINGVSGEPTHIWDKDAKLIPSYFSYFQHWKQMFEIGNKMRRLGWKPIKLTELIKIWFKQNRLMKQYPKNH